MEPLGDHNLVECCIQVGCNQVGCNQVDCIHADYTQVDCNLEEVEHRAGNLAEVRVDTNTQVLKQMAVSKLISRILSEQTLTIVVLTRIGWWTLRLL